MSHSFFSSAHAPAAEGHTKTLLSFAGADNQRPMAASEIASVEPAKQLNIVKPGHIHKQCEIGTANRQKFGLIVDGFSGRFNSQ
jgi:hypothetical protein